MYIITRKYNLDDIIDSKINAKLQDILHKIQCRSDRIKEGIIAVLMGMIAGGVYLLLI